MARQQTAQFPLDGGIDQRTHERYVQPPALLDAVNVRYRTIGGVEARPGCESITSAIGLSAMGTSRGKLFSFRESLIASDMVRIGALATVDGDEVLVDRGRVPEATCTMASIAGAPYIGVQHDVLCHDGLIFYVWVSVLTVGGTDGGIRYSVQDAATGAYIKVNVALTTVSGFFCPKMAVVNDMVRLFYADTGNQILVSDWDSGAAAFDTGSAIIANNSSFFDVSYEGLYAYVLFKSSTTDLPVIAEVDAAGSINDSSGTSETDTDTTAYGICMTGNAREVWVSYFAAADNDVRAVRVNIGAGTEPTPTFDVYTLGAGEDSVTSTSPCRLSSTTACVLATGLATQDAARVVWAPIINTSGTVLTAGDDRRTFWAYAISKPFVAAQSPLRCYAWLAAGGTRLDYDEYPSIGIEQPRQYTMMLVDLMVDMPNGAAIQARPIGSLAPRYTVGDFHDGHPLCGVFQTGTKYSTLFRTVPIAGHSNSYLAEADFAFSGHLTPAELGDTLHVSPGFFWDGAKLAEIGFAYWPQKLSDPTFSNTASGTLVAGTTYRWRALYEYVDFAGNIHRSQPSEYTEAEVTVGNDTVSFDVPCLTLTERQHQGDESSGDGVRIVLYRTDDVTVDPNTYYRVAVAMNGPGDMVATIVDTGSKALDTLYTQGGVLPNVMPQSMTAVVTYRNRLWGAYGQTVVYSKAFVSGEAVSFTDAFTLPLEESGNVTAMWVQDDVLYISTASRIYYIAAEGPTDLNTFNDVPTPNQVATDFGVVEPRSLVVTSLGTFYRSRTGICLLDRGRNVSVEPVSSRVQRLLDQYPTITSAIVHPTGSYVTFSCTDGVNGIRLVYDYTQNKWSRDLLFEDGGAPPIIVDVANVDGQHYFLADGTLYRETSDSGLDDGQWVTHRLKLAWLKPAGLQGYADVARFTLQTERETHSDITITSYVDYESTPLDTETWLANSGTKPINSMTIPQFETAPSRQRVQAIRWDIEDAAPTGASVGTGAGHVFVGMAVDVDVIGDTFRMPAGQKG